MQARTRLRHVNVACAEIRCAPAAHLLAHNDGSLVDGTTLLRQTSTFAYLPSTSVFWINKRLSSCL